MTSSHVVVIGAGIGGMAAALRLRARGYDVTVLERGDQPGGRARSFEHEGVRHDAGPTVITAPFLFDELFALFGRRRADYVEFRELNPWYRFHFQDGESFDYGGTLDQTLDEIERLSPADRARYPVLLAQSKRIFDVGFTRLAARPFHNPMAMLAQTPHLIRLRSDRSVWRMIRHYIRDPRLAQALAISPLLVGGNPMTTTSIYSLIHYLEREWGVHFAMGGTGALVRALKTLMDESGIAWIPNATVSGFTYDGNKISAVNRADARPLRADHVVFNGDPLKLYRDLLPADKIRWSARLKTRGARLSMGLFVLYFGTRRTYPDIAHHTVWMGLRFEGLLNDIFKRKVLARDFSLYIHRPTATDPSFAPEGCESFYVLAPVPNLQAGIDWEEEKEAYTARILEALERSIMPGLRENVFGLFAMTPADFEQDYLSHAGTAFSVAPHLTQSAWFRFHNRAEGPANLYLCGAGTHPGAGLPGVLSSAKIVEKLVCRD